MGLVERKKRPLECLTSKPSDRSHCRQNSRRIQQGILERAQCLESLQSDSEWADNSLARARLRTDSSTSPRKRPHCCSESDQPFSGPSFEKGKWGILFRTSTSRMNPTGFVARVPPIAQPRCAKGLKKSIIQPRTWPLNMWLARRSGFQSMKVAKVVSSIPSTKPSPSKR